MKPGHLLPRLPLADRLKALLTDPRLGAVGRKLHRIALPRARVVQRHHAACGLGLHSVRQPLFHRHRAHARSAVGSHYNAPDPRRECVGSYGRLEKERDHGHDQWRTLVRSSSSVHACAPSRGIVALLQLLRF